MPHRAFDHLEVRCPQLGHQVQFSYCRRMNEGLPCPKAIDCFHLKFPAQEYFRRVLKEETFQRIFLDPKPDRYQKFLETLDRVSRQKSGE